MKQFLTPSLFAVLLVATVGCGDSRSPAAPRPPKPPAGGSKGGSKAAAAPKPAGVTAAEVRAAAKKAAGALVAMQNKDGSFGKQGISVGMTGLAVISLAETGAGGAAGDAAVQKGVACMLKFKQPDGGVYVKGRPYNSYETSIAIMALAAADKARYKDVIDAGVKYLKGIQDDGSKKATNKGGIGYGSKGVNSNMSTTHYALQAFKAAGLSEKDEAWKKAVAFISICQNQAETNEMEYAAVINDGGFIYSPAGGKTKPVTKRGKTGWRSYGSMTYAGYLSYVYARLSTDDPRVKGAEKWMQNNYTLEENPAFGQQGLFYFYQTFALALDARGDRIFPLADGRKLDWSRELSAKLISLQKPDGTWINTADRWYESDPVICTSYSLRALGRALKYFEVK